MSKSKVTSRTQTIPTIVFIVASLAATVLLVAAIATWSVHLSDTRVVLWAVAAVLLYGIGYLVLRRGRSRRS